MLNRHVKCLSLLLALMMALCAVCTAAAEQEKRKMENPADADEWIAAKYSMLGSAALTAAAVCCTHALRRMKK